MTQEQNGKPSGGVKAVIMVGGPSIGTRFRPLAMHSPKPLFPIAGKPMIMHHIEACVQVPRLTEIYLMGFFPEKDFTAFIAETSKQLKVNIKYLEEEEELGTAGGLNTFRELIKKDNPDDFFVLHCDVCCAFQLKEMFEFHSAQVAKDKELLGTLMGSTVSREHAQNYGCLIADENDRIRHYAEKPETHISSLINSGVYCFRTSVLELIKEVVDKVQKEQGALPLRASLNSLMRRSGKHVSLEQDLLVPFAAKQKFSVYRNQGFWKQVKNAGAPVYCNEFYLELLAKKQFPFASKGE